MLRMIYIFFKLPHLNYSLPSSGTLCRIATKEAVKVKFESHFAATYKQLKLPDMYACQSSKLYYKLYRNKLPVYFEIFLLEHGDAQYNCICFSVNRCEYSKFNVNYQI